jgi:hypothetical protein
MSILSIKANAMKALKSAGINKARWSKPKPSHIKLNADASFHEDRRAGATGAVLRVYKGHFIAAPCVFILHVTSPSMAKAIAMREGLELASKMSCTSTRV